MLSKLSMELEPRCTTVKKTMSEGYLHIFFKLSLSASTGVHRCKALGI